MRFFEKNLKQVLDLLLDGLITINEAVSGSRGIVILAPEENPIHPRLLSLIFELVRKGEIGEDFVLEEFETLRGTSDEEYLKKLSLFLRKLVHGMKPKNCSHSLEGGDVLENSPSEVFEAEVKVY